MYKLFQEGLCRAHLRALQDYLKLSSTKDVQPVVDGVEKPSIHLLAKLTGSAGTRRQLQLLIQNTGQHVIESVDVMLHAEGNNNELMTVEPSCRQVGLLLPSAQQWITVNVQDPTGQGGQVSIVVTKDVADEVEVSPVVPGHVIYSAKVEIAPFI